MKWRRLSVHLSLAALAIVAGSTSTTAVAHGSLPHDTPVDRLVKNLDARLAKNPDDADLHYMLGRLHALVFETKYESVPIWPWSARRRDDPEDQWTVIETKWWVARSTATGVERRASTDDELHVHLREALSHLNRAIELAPAVAAYRLALASILESGEPMASEIDVSPLCPVRGVERRAPTWIVEAVQKFDTDQKLRKDVEEALRSPGFGGRTPGERDEIVTSLYRERRSDDPNRRKIVRALLLLDWREQITQQYFVALALALSTEGSNPTQPPLGWETKEAYVSYEAASAFVRIVAARGARPEDAVHLATAKAVIAAFDGLPPARGITPILFSLDGARPLSDLLEPGASTTFDLDGFGCGQRWPWVARDTGILVWDPNHTGRITSGRQLFGSVSWWLFFQDGYDALAALDDDADGELSGRELDGLAAWFDKNGDGRSDPGEVAPVGELGISGLSSRATGTTGESLCNPRGLRLTSGAVLPTYDWIAHPIAAPATVASCVLGSIADRR